MNEEIEVKSGERLARIEEQLKGVREDIIEMKESIAVATKIMGELHISYIPRTEAEKAESIQNKRIERLERDVEKLKLWRSWLTGIIAVLSGAFAMFFEYGKQWFSSGSGGH
jgi:hypothetical protein